MQGIAWVALIVLGIGFFFSFWPDRCVPVMVFRVNRHAADFVSLRSR